MDPVLVQMGFMTIRLTKSVINAHNYVWPAKMQPLVKFVNQDLIVKLIMDSVYVFHNIMNRISKLFANSALLIV